MLPSNRPFTNLAKALLDESILRSAYTAYFTNRTEAVTSLQAKLRRGPFSLHEILQENPLPPDTQLLLLVDQFEEIFRHYKQGNVDETAAFVKLEKVATLANVTCEQVIAVVEVFRCEGRCFLTPPLGKPLEPDTVLDISHESLIRQWKRLKV